MLARPPARKISPACDTHFSRLTVVEGREITTARRKGPPSQYLSREEPFSCAPLARSLFLARRGWQKSRSGRLVISHFPKQRHRQAVALFLPHASLPPVPRRCLSLSLSLHGTHPLSSSFPLYSRSLSISSRSVYPSTGRSHYSLSLSLSYFVSPRGSVPSSCLSRTQSLHTGHPSSPRTSRPRFDYETPTPRPRAVSLPSRVPSTVASRRSRLLPSQKRNAAAAAALVFASSPGAKPLARLS